MKFHGSLRVFIVSFDQRLDKLRDEDRADEKCKDLLGEWSNVFDEGASVGGNDCN